MSAYAVPRNRDNLTPAILAAIALHAGLFLFFTRVVKPAPLTPIGSSVPVHIVSQAPATDSRPAVEAEEVQAAAVEAPQPEAPPTPPPPAAAPKPMPAKPAPPAPSPKPAPTPTPAKPTTAKPAPTPPHTAFDPQAIADSIARFAKPAPPKPSSARQGPTRPETDTHVRPDAGNGVSESDLVGLRQLLERLWNPNCGVEGGANVKLKATFNVGPTGRLVGAVSAGGAERSSDPLTFAAARRAVDAVHQVEPFPEPYYGQKITVNFDAKEACSKR